jgi:signal transduction histidine kinase
VRSGLAISHAGWVRSLGIGAVLLIALWNLNKLRLKYARKGARFLEDERRAERKRIARELHDTLLQGLQGILLEFEVLSSSLPEDERERAIKIERKLRHIVVDGRNAVNALRLPEDSGKDWMAAVLEIGERAAADSKMEFDLKIEGQTWGLPIRVRTEVLAIVREGLRNAFEHSCAKTVVVVIRYAKRGLKISIQDNGIGVSEQQLKLRQSEGHWGIAGMRERAEKLHGRLTIVSQPSKGTTVNLIMLRRAISMKSRLSCTAGMQRRWGRRKPQLSLARLLSRIGR